MARLGGLFENQGIRPSASGEIQRPNTSNSIESQLKRITSILDATGKTSQKQLNSLQEELEEQRRHEEARERLNRNDRVSPNSSGAPSGSGENPNRVSPQDRLGMHNILNNLKGLRQGIMEGLSEGFANSSMSASFGAMKANPYAAAAGMLEEGLRAAFVQTREQMAVQNETLIDLQRNTGGLIDAGRIGADVYGNLTKRSRSLMTEANRANVSLDDVKDSLASVATAGFGNYMGVGYDIDKSQMELKNLGIDAARIKKLYNTDIIPAVGGLMKNFGYKSITQVKDIMIAGVQQARAQGIDPAGFSLNMQRIVDLSGKIHFKNGVKGMKDMALYATKLGLSIDDVAEGIFKMKNFQDVFVEQQKLMSLGFGASAAATGNIFALTQQGQHQEALNATYAALGEDFKNNIGGFDGQNLTMKGIQQLEAAGLEKDQITAFEKLLRQEAELGLSIEQLTGSINNLSERDAAALARIEEMNITTAEAWKQTMGELRSNWTDFLANTTAPLVEGLTGILSSKNQRTQLNAARNEAGMSWWEKVMAKKKSEKVINEIMSDESLTPEQRGKAITLYQAAELKAAKASAEIAMNKKIALKSETKTGVDSIVDINKYLQKLVGTTGDELGIRQQLNKELEEQLNAQEKLTNKAQDVDWNIVLGKAIDNLVNRAPDLDGLLIKPPRIQPGTVVLPKTQTSTITSQTTNTQQQAPVVNVNVNQSNDLINETKASIAN